MGKQPYFDDAALQTAESLLSSLPAPSACQHVFSELFLKKIERLRRRYSWKKAGRTAGRYAAAILLTASLTLGAIMAVSPQARAGIMQWVREKQENRIIYRFYKEQKPLCPCTGRHGSRRGWSKRSTVTINFRISHFITTMKRNKAFQLIIATWMTVQFRW